MIDFRRRPYTAPITYKIVLFAPEGICATSNESSKDTVTNTESAQEERS